MRRNKGQPAKIRAAKRNPGKRPIEGDIPKPEPITPLLNSIPMACARLGHLSRGTIYEFIKAGVLKTVKFGSRTLIPELELRRLAEAIAAGQFTDGFRGLADETGDRGLADKTSEPAKARR